MALGSRDLLGVYVRADRTNSGVPINVLRSKEYFAGHRSWEINCATVFALEDFSVTGERLFQTFCCLFIIFAGWQNLALRAQLTRSVISGSVTDPSGSAIPQARVRIINQANGEERELTTNRVGLYRFVAVEPGVYSVVFSSPGFRDSVVDGVRIGPAAEAVIDERLEVAGPFERIEVRAAPPVEGFSPATATIGLSVEPRAIESFPTNPDNRDVSGLAFLSPGIARGPGFTEISASGQRTRQNNFMIDGTDNNDLTVTIPSARIIPEAISEFRVQTSANSAEYGRNTGAQISVITQSGGNTLHGEAWDYYRANWMEPASLLNKRSGLTSTPRFVQHQAGADLGGPIRKNKSFFYGLVEGDWRRDAPDARNAQPAVIPTPTGFAALRDIPLGPDQTLSSRQSVLNALSFLPDIYKEVRFKNISNQSINGVPVEMGTIGIPLSSPFNSWYGILRLDHKLSSQDNLTYRYLLDTRSRANAGGNLQFGSRFSAALDYTVQNHELSWTRSFQPDLTNEFRFSYGRTNLDSPENDPTSSTVYVSNLFQIGGGRNFPQQRIQDILQWQDVISYWKGRNSIKLGVGINRNRLFDLAASDSKGTWFFSGFADFLNNRAQILRQAISSATFDAKQTSQSYFLQDDFRFNENLTFNLGMRYEVSGVPFGFFGAASPEIAAAGVPLPAVPDKNNWAPRLGLAYSPSVSEGWARRLLGNHQTVFRAGFGLSYDVLFFNILSVTATNYPRVINFDVGKPETFNLFPTLASKNSAIPPFNPLMPFANVPSDIQNPTTQSWNVTIQRQLGRHYLFEIGYKGNRSYHLVRLGEHNPARLTPEQARLVKMGEPIPSVQGRRLNPNWGYRASIEAAALSKYHALFISLERRMTTNFLMGVNYTWSGTFSDNDAALGTGDIVRSSPRVPQDFLNYRNEWSRSVFDRPHRLVTHFVYQLPLGGLAAHGSPFLNQILQGWQVSGVFEWQSGQPFTVRTGVDSGGSGVAVAEGAWRPDLNQGGVFIKDPVEGDLRTFKTPLDGTGIFLTPLGSDGFPLANSMPGGGNLGRNTFRGPGYINADFSLTKQFRVSEKITMQLRADWFNIANHRNFGNPVAIMSSPAFGTNDTDPGGRTMLLALKLTF